MIDQLAYIAECNIPVEQCLMVEVSISAELGPGRVFAKTDCNRRRRILIIDNYAPCSPHRRRCASPLASSALSHRLRRLSGL